MVTQSGKLREGAKDIFEARIFHATHPDGTPVESYITLTSEAGASAFVPAPPTTVSLIESMRF